jgi:hypothetical protein
MNTSLGFLQWASNREQKKLAPRIPRSLQILATVYAMVVFPVPANPLIQYMRRASVIRNVVQAIYHDEV